MIVVLFQELTNVIFDNKNVLETYLFTARCKKNPN